ncbi:hypothetical protein, partial [Streptomyces pimonensis]|uniref:hypothetical protein n=1 Tax=Streptomyces pimonensis TaxID=2860288 RepID=UPI00352948EA
MSAPAAAEAGLDPSDLQVISEATPAFITSRRPTGPKELGPSGDKCIIQFSSSTRPGSDTAGESTAVGV